MLNSENDSGALVLDATARQRVAVTNNMAPNLPLANARSVFQHRVEHGLSSPGELEMTLAPPRSLSAAPVPRKVVGALTQLIEQPRVLEGDHRLSGEVLDQLDLLVGEWADLLAVNDDSAD